MARLLTDSTAVFNAFDQGGSNRPRIALDPCDWSGLEQKLADTRQRRHVIPRCYS
jgi:hypothetical protein